MGVGGIPFSPRGCLEEEEPVRWEENQEHKTLSKQVYQKRNGGQLHWNLLRYQVRTGTKICPSDLAKWKPLVILVRTFRGKRSWKKSYRAGSKHSRIKYWNDEVHENILRKRDSENREWTQVRNQAHRRMPGQSTTTKWQRTIWSKRILSDHLIKPWLYEWNDFLDRGHTVKRWVSRD